jgi:hypothetical protein
MWWWRARRKDSAGSRFEALDAVAVLEAATLSAVEDNAMRKIKNRPARPVLYFAGPLMRPTCKPYWLAPDAGAAAEATASEAAAAADEAAAEADAAASVAAAAALDAAAVASDAAAVAAEAAAAVSLAALGAAVSLDLLHAARATAANRDATRRDFFMITSFYG